MPRELIDTGRSKRFVRRDAAGQFDDVSEVGRSLSQDRRRKAKRVVRSGEGDRGDQKPRAKKATTTRAGAKRATTRATGAERTTTRAGAKRATASRAKSKRATARPRSKPKQAGRSRSRAKR